MIILCRLKDWRKFNCSYMEIVGILKDIGIFGLAMWFIQHILNKSADRKFETHKMELDQKTREFQTSLDCKLESYKIEMNLQNYKTTKIYEQQLTVIIEFHKKLTKLIQETVLLQVSLMKTMSENNEETTQKEIKQAANTCIVYDDFSHFFKDNFLFIPNKTADKVNDILKKCSSVFINYVSRRETNNDFTFQQVKNDIQIFVDEMQQAQALLNLDFKKLLGVEK